MATVDNNFTITRGDTYKETWEFKDALGAVLNLTGAKLYFTAKSAVTDADGSAALSLSSPASGIVINANPALGTATFTISAAQSAALTPKTYYYDIQYKNTAGEISTLFNGIMTVVPDITISTS